VRQQSSYAAAVVTVELQIGNVAPVIAAQLFHRMWSGLTQNLSKSCESLAASLRASSVDEESNAKILDSHASRIRLTREPPEKWSQGVK